MKLATTLPMNVSSFSLALTTCAFLSLAGPQAASAAPFYLQADMDGVANLNNTAIYNSQPNGSGSAPLTMAGNSFFTNGKTIRFQNGAGVGGSFVGDQLTLDASGNLKATAGYTVGNLTVTTGAGSYAGKVGILANTGAANSSLTLGSLSIGTGATLSLTNLNTTNAMLTLGVTTLSGAGNLSIGGATLSGGVTYFSQTGNTLRLSITDADSYTGTILWGSAVTQNVVLDFNNTFSSQGGLIARGNDRINLDQDLTFASVTLNGVSLTNGTYTYAQLSGNATYGSIFSGGSGSITVIPEPSAAALATAGLTATLVHRKRRTPRLA